MRYSVKALTHSLQRGLAALQPLSRIPALMFCLGVISTLASFWLFKSLGFVEAGSGVTPAGQYQIIANAAERSEAQRKSWQSIFAAAYHERGGAEFTRLDGVSGLSFDAGEQGGVHRNAAAGKAADPVAGAAPLPLPAALQVGETLKLQLEGGEMLTFRIMERNAADCRAADASKQPVPDVELVNCDEHARHKTADWRYIIEAIDVTDKAKQAVQRSL